MPMQAHVTQCLSMYPCVLRPQTSEEIVETRPSRKDNTFEGLLSRKPDDMEIIVQVCKHIQKVCVPDGVP